MTKKSTLRGVLINPKRLAVAHGVNMVTVSLEVVEIPHDYKEIQRILGTGCFDMATRSINGERFDIYCDDEVFYNGNNVVTALSKTDANYNLIGSLFFTKYNGNGNTRSLTDKEIEKVKKAFDGVSVCID